MIQPWAEVHTCLHLHWLFLLSLACLPHFEAGETEAQRRPVFCRVYTARWCLMPAALPRWLTHHDWLHRLWAPCSRITKNFRTVAKSIKPSMRPLSTAHWDCPGCTPLRPALHPPPSFSHLGSCVFPSRSVCDKQEH